MNNRLRVLRAERQWSQAHLADLIGVSRQTINAIETGRYDPSLSVAFRLARIFDDRVDDIFFDDEPSTTAQHTTTAGEAHGA